VNRGGRPAAALAASIALALAGCLTDAPAPSSSVTPSPAPDPTATVTTYRLETTVWYAGFVLTFGTATATIDPKGGPVAVEVAFQNAGPEAATLGGPIILASRGRAVGPSRDSVLPLVPVGERSEAVLIFEVDGAFDLAAAALRIGRPEEHQGIVPLVEGAADPHALEPLTVSLSGSGQAGALRVTLSAAELRSDLPDWGVQLPRAVMALTVTYDAAYRSDFAGGFAFTTANLGLRLPDGTTISAREDGHSAPATVIGPGAVVSGLQSRFEVPVPGPGTYGLVVRDGDTTTVIEVAILDL
jgi:hypothetical protein